MQKLMSTLVVSFTCIILMTSQSQVVSWNRTLNYQTYNSSITYAGHNQHGHYYYRIRPTGILIFKDNIDVFFINNSNEIKAQKEPISISGKVVSALVDDNAISFIVHEAALFEKHQELKVINLDPRSLTVRKERTLLQEPIKLIEELNIRFRKSSDGSKILLSYLHLSSGREARGSLKLMVFNEQMEPLWQKNFLPELGVKYSRITLLDYCITDKAEVFVLFGTSIDVKKGVTSNQYLHVISFDENQERVYSFEQGVNNNPNTGRMLVVDNLVYFTAYFDAQILTGLYDLKREDLITLTPSNKGKGSNAMAEEIFRLENGNVVTIGRSRRVIFVDNRPGEYLTWDIYLTCVDPEGQLVYDNRIIRAGVHKGFVRIRDPWGVAHDYKAVGSDVFVFYNDLISNEKLKEWGRNKAGFHPLKPGKGAMYVTRINSTGQMERRMLNAYKKDPFVFHPSTFPINENDQGILKFNQKKAMIGTFHADRW